MEGNPGQANAPAVPSKRSWPLVLLAATSFVPGIGFVLGAIAVTWGLASDRPRSRLAIGLGAAGALLQVGASLIFVLLFQDSPSMREARASTSIADLTKLVAALDNYHIREGHYPSNLQVLVGFPIPQHLLNIYDQSGGLFRQVSYTYRIAADGESFDLFAVGRDGLPGTADDIRPVLSDSILAHTGYRPDLQ